MRDEKSPMQTTEKPRFCGSSEIQPVPLDERWNLLALAEARQQEFRRDIRVIFCCLEGHPHDTYEAAAECMAERFRSATTAIVEAERAER